jgi:hypothetical protein
MVVLGLGLGLVMQVLVLAAQNAVDYKYLGVASSGSTLFRQIGGAIGVSIFGAIFANQLAHTLARELPAGVHVPRAADPAALKRLPPALHDAYATAITDALHTVFFAAAGIAVLAFFLTWLLREVPLKATAQAPDVGDGFHAARDDNALRELQRALSLLAGRNQRWDFYQSLAARAGLDLAPPEALAASATRRTPTADPTPADRTAARRRAPDRRGARAAAEAFARAQRRRRRDRTHDVR